MGIWQDPRDLLLAAPHGPSWDTRMRYISVLGASAVGLEWPNAWASAEPGNPDVAVVQAYAAVLVCLEEAALRHGQHSGRLGTTPAHAINLCRRAASAVPDDPAPWVSLLMLARCLDDNGDASMQLDVPPFGLEVPATLGDWWMQAVKRHPQGWAVHQAMIQALSPTYLGRNTSYRMLYYARQVASAAPEGSPLLLLPLYALVLAYGQERSRRETEWGRQFWREAGLSLDIDRAWTRWWLSPKRDRRHPYATDDLNLLAGVLWELGRPEANEVLTAIRYITSVPWCYLETCGLHTTPDQKFRAVAASCEDSVRRRSGSSAR